MEYKWATTETPITKAMLRIDSYVVTWAASKKEKTAMEDGKLEIWRKMLIISQARVKPVKQKMFKYENIKGALYVELRIAKTRL